MSSHPPSSTAASLEDDAQPMVGDETSDQTATPDLDKRSWCPSTVAQIRQQFSSDTADFLFSLPRKPAALRDHSQCTTRTCTANNTNDDDYQSSHWGKCGGNCAFEGPDVRRIIEIIHHGGFPLISLRRTKDGAIVINVVRATSKTKYAAISHVWSGGLGNPAANTLPRCQITRLYELGLEFNGERRKGRFGNLFTRDQAVALFWMDTLCVPVGDDSLSRSLRAQTINLMAQIYAAARAIIILDHELQQFRFEGNSTAVKLGLLICSAWMSRCWTFQEGVLAAEWFVHFEDGLYNMDKLQQASEDCRQGEDSDSAHRLIERTWDLKRHYQRLPRLTSLEGQITFKQRLHVETAFLFLSVWNSLCTRSTTKREDLISIISIVLGFKPRDILMMEPEKRLLAIFNSQKVLPIALLFRSRPSVETWADASRWLPSKIEDLPIERHGGAMWRRSPEEDFFVFELSKSGYIDDNFDAPMPKQRLPRFYFSESRIAISGTLSLVDCADGTEIEVRAKLSPLLTIPILNVCVVMGRVRKGKTAFGALLGVRERTPQYVRLFYLCSVESISACRIIPDRSETRSVLYRKTLNVGVEYVFEHDFSDTSRSLATRAPFPLNTNIYTFARIGTWPFLVRMVYWIYVHNVIASYMAIQRRPLHNLSSALIVRTVRGVDYCTAMAYLEKLEFDEWFADLYEQRVQIWSYRFYVHASPRRYLLLSFLGLVSLGALKRSEGLSGFIAIPFLWLATEAALPPLNWFLEIYSRAPPDFNILYWFVAVGQETGNPRTPWYYQRFYAKSRFTVQVEYLMSTILAAVRSYARPSDVLALENGLRTTASAPPSSRSTSEGTPVDMNAGPWTDESASSFVSSHVDYTFAGRFWPIRDDTNFAVRKYLGEVLVYPYLVLFFYWSCAWLISAFFWIRIQHTAIILIIAMSEWTCFAILPLEIVLFLNRVSLPARITGWRRLIHRDVADLSALHISIHYSPRNTTILFCVCCPLVVLLWIPGHDFGDSMAAACAALQLGSLAVRWFLELHSSRRTEIWLEPAIEKDAQRKMCEDRFYAKSRFTVWVEHAFDWAWATIRSGWTTLRSQQLWSPFTRIRFSRRAILRWTRGRGVSTDSYADDGDYYLDAEEQLLLTEYRDIVDA